MKIPMEIDQMYARQARKAEALTPAHAAAEAQVRAADDEDARRRRDRVRHEVDPLPTGLPEVAHADLGKLYRDALDVPAHPDFPAPGPVYPEMFRRGPVTAGEAAYSPAYEAPGWSVPVPSAVLTPGMISRPLLSDGQSRPCAPEAC